MTGDQRPSIDEELEQRELSPELTAEARMFLAAVRRLDSQDLLRLVELAIVRLFVIKHDTFGEKNDEQMRTAINWAHDEAHGTLNEIYQQLPAIG